MMQKDQLLWLGSFSTKGWKTSLMTKCLYRYYLTSIIANNNCNISILRMTHCYFLETHEDGKRNVRIALFHSDITVLRLITKKKPQERKGRGIIWVNTVTQVNQTNQKRRKKIYLDVPIQEFFNPNSLKNNLTRLVRIVIL